LRPLLLLLLASRRGVCEPRRRRMQLDGSGSLAVT